MIPEEKALGSFVQFCHCLTFEGEAISSPSLYCHAGSDFRVSRKPRQNAERLLSIILILGELRDGLPPTPCSAFWGFFCTPCGQNTTVLGLHSSLVSSELCTKSGLFPSDKRTKKLKFLRHRPYTVSVKLSSSFAGISSTGFGLVHKPKLQSRLWSQRTSAV